ncbi:hypothetical protein E1J61_10000 [Cupriavidus sp. L7L]|nr:hypothetical protein E1J61_10000 [Cupriavidus sp. L7L]
MNSAPFILLGLVVFELLWFVPFQRVFRQAHFSSGYAYLSLVPLLGPLLCIWILASKRWPLKSKLVKSYS